MLGFQPRCMMAAVATFNGSTKLGTESRWPTLWQQLSCLVASILGFCGRLALWLRPAGLRFGVLIKKTLYHVQASLTKWGFACDSYASSLQPQAGLVFYVRQETILNHLSHKQVGFAILKLRRLEACCGLNVRSSFLLRNCLRYQCQWQLASDCGWLKAIEDSSCGATNIALATWLQLQLWTPEMTQCWRQGCNSTLRFQSKRILSLKIWDTLWESLICQTRALSLKCLCAEICIRKLCWSPSDQRINWCKALW